MIDLFEGTLLELFFRPMMKVFYGFSLGGKKKKASIQTYNPPPYTGPTPYTGEQTGYGAPQLKTLSDYYLPGLISRAKGESGVGFDPQHRANLQNEFFKNFGNYESDIYRKSEGQSSGQGLRGGIPLSIQAMNTRNLSNARETGLANIDTADLEARRADMNNAFYQLPQEVARGTGIQQNASNFGLDQYNATKPEPYFQPKSDNSWLSSVLSTSFLPTSNNFLQPQSQGGGAGTYAPYLSPQELIRQNSLGNAYSGQVSNQTSGVNKSLGTALNIAKLAAMFLG